MEDLETKQRIVESFIFYDMTPCNMQSSRNSQMVLLTIVSFDRTVQCGGPKIYSSYSLSSELFTSRHILIRGIL